MAARTEATATAAVVSVPTTVAGGLTMEAAAAATAATTNIETITATGIIKTTTTGGVTNAVFLLGE